MGVIQSINAQQIASSIGSPERAVSIVRDLVWAEAGRQLVNLTKISVSSKIYAKDGGVDGTIDISPQIESGLLTKGQTYFQIKWGDTFCPQNEKHLMKELTTKKDLKPKLKKLSESNGRYVLFWFGGVFKSNEKDECCEKIKGIFRNNKFPEVKVDVLDQDDISQFVNLHPVIVSKYFTPLTEFFVTLDSWKDRFWKDEEINDKYIESVLQSNFSTVKTILTSNITSPYNPIQLISHDEKQHLDNRILIYTIFSEESFRSRTICIDADEFVSPLTTTLESREDLNQIIIIDNCKKIHHKAILDVLGNRTRRLNMIVLSTDNNAIQNPLFSKIGWHGSEHSIFLQEIDKIKEKDIIPKINLHYESQVPSLQRIQLPSFIPRAYSKISEEYGFVSLNTCKRVLRYIALFSSIGSENNRTKELEYLANNAGFEHEKWLDFVESIHILRKVGLVIGKHYIKIQNKEHRQHLIHEWWEIYGPIFDFKEFLTNTYTYSENLAGRLVDSLSYINTEKGREIAKILLSNHGPFASGKLFWDNFGSRVFNSLVDADPESALNLLNHTIRKWNHEDLLQYTMRRDIVYALEKTSWWSDLFDDSAQILFRLSCAENEPGISNNATGTFVDLFSPGYGNLAPTEKPPLQRFNIIRRIFESKSETEIEIALKSCSKALESTHLSRFVQGDGPWARRPFKPWTPKTYGEIFDYYKTVWIFLDEQIDTLNSPLKEQAIKILAEKSRGLIRIESLSDMIIETFCNLAEKQDIDKREIIDAVASIIKFDSSKFSPTMIQNLKDLDQKLIGTSYSSKMDRFVGMYIISEEFKDRQKQEIHNLIQEGIDNNSLIIKELPKLVRKGMHKASEFGYELSKSDKDFSLFDSIIEKQKKTNLDEQDLSFLAGYCRFMFEKEPDKLDQIFDKLSRFSQTVKWVPYLVYGSRFGLRDKDLIRIVQLAEKKKVSKSDLYMLYYGGSTRTVSEKIFLRLAKLLKSDKQSYFNLLEIFNQYFIHRQNKQLPKSFTYSILTSAFMNKPPVDVQFNHSTYSYVEIAKQFIKQYPDQGLKLLKKFLDDGKNKESFIYKFDSAFEEILTELTLQDDDKVWTLIEKYLKVPLDIVSYRLRNWLRGSSFFSKKNLGGLILFKPETVIKWIDKNPKERVDFIVGAIPYDLENKSPKISWTREILIRYGEYAEIRSGLMANFSTEGFSGSLVKHYETKKERLLKMREQESEPKIIHWLDEYISSINSDIERGRHSEESDNF